jgi:diguanylate cyclase (GGDEF)-like protein/PAS domain S-box-containing protein
MKGPDILATASDAAAAKRDRRRLVRETLAVALAASIIAAVGVIGLWIAAARTIRDNYGSYLTGIARAAAQHVDPALHNSLRDPAQRNGPDYARAVEPLRQMRAALPDVRFIYTMVRDGDQVRFVLDAAHPGDHDGDGIDDQAALWEIYAEREPAMMAALGAAGIPGKAAATDRPFGDKWGNFMTGWAPLMDAQGQQFGALGIDIDAERYVALLDRARRWALFGMLPSALLIALLGFGYYRIRDRALAAGRAAARTAVTLSVEQQRLGHIVERVNIGTWETTFDAQDSGLIVVDDRWAGMLGRRAEDLNPLTSANFFTRLVHPEDALVVQAAIRNAHADSSGGLLDIDLRMRHAEGHWVWTEVRGRVAERDARGNPVRVIGTQIDVSARKAAEMALVESEGNFRSLFELSPVGICLAELPGGRYLRVNDALVASTGYTREELLERTFWDITPPHCHALVREQQAQSEVCADFGPYETEYQRKDGSCFPVLVSGQRLVDAAGRKVGWAIVQDISKRKAMESELEAAARVDRLTGLCNRALFLEWLQIAVDGVRDGRQQRFAVLFLDFDRFKLVNDAMGHEAGDVLLQQIATRLRDSLHGPGNLVARFGGDEFLVLLNDVEDGSEAQRIANALLESLARAYVVHGRELYSTASIGIVTSDQCLESAEAVVRNADVAMYEAKRLGRGCAVMFDDAMRARLTRFVSIEGSLRAALGTSQLSLVYQPIIDLATGRMASVEALARWHHPQLGDISPAEFIPVAEESGLIASLGQWVLHEACSALASWRALDPQGAPQTMCVNISRAELALGDRLMKQVSDTLLRTCLPPQCLRLEVTERDAIRNPTITLQLMHGLRRMGVLLAMDDFGTGTSSLGCLRDYPFDVIKIDRSFVSDLTSSPDVQALIHAAVTLVGNLGKTSIAEGVETREQVAVLQSLGCHYAQGYFFSRPLTATQMLEFMAVPGEALLA